jgi:PqqD family protein of HPr-rel-A system
MDSNDVTWRLATDDLRRRAWDGQMVVYDPRSGDTHCLDHLAAAVLSHLFERRTATARSLREQLPHDPPSAGEPRAEDVLTNLLAELEKLRLVRRLAP